MELALKNASEIILDGGLSKCTPIFSGCKIIKVGRDGLKISVINRIEEPQITTILTGHEKPILSTALSQDRSILCSCSEDKVILWNLNPLKNAEDLDKKGVVIAENIGYSAHCGLSWNKKWLSLCIVREIWIILLSQTIFKMGKDDGFHCHTILKTNSSQVNSCSFSSEFEDILVSVEDYNHFKVWDLLTSSLMYRSATMVNNCITCCSVSGIPNKLLIGTTTGFIHVYNFVDKYVPNLCRTININEKYFMDQRENNSGKVSGSLLLNSNNVANQEELWFSKGCIIFSMCIFNGSNGKNESNKMDGRLHTTKDILTSIMSLGSVLVTACSLGIVIYSFKSSDCIGFLTYSDQRISDALPSAQFYLIDYVILTGETLQNIQCWIKTPSSQQNLYLLNLSFEESETQSSDCTSLRYECISHLSFLSSSPLSNKSPLSYHIKMNEKSSYMLGLSKSGINDRVNINSSGYGKGPRKKMFSPITNVTKNSKVPIKSRKITGIFHRKHICDEKNALSHGPPEYIERNILICKTTGISSKLAYTEDGEHIACSSMPSQVCILPSDRLQLDKSTHLAGHDSSINSVTFNLNSKWLLSSSSDSTVRVWDWRNRDCILKIEMESKSISNMKRDFSANPVRQASFFYLDKFILMARNDQIDLYYHSLHKKKSGSNWRMKGDGYHRVKCVSFPTQHVTCFTAANQFHSYLVMAGCSNRDIMVYDLNHQKFLCNFKEAHLHRPPHRLVQFTGSTCPSVPAQTPDAYNLFLSTAITDGVKLWDLRTQKCIQKYDRHLNRVYASGIDISPCSRFVATCSEDKRVYIYDTRDCENYLSTIGGFPDFVMDVAFSPCMTQLAASSLNGHLLTFKSKPLAITGTEQ